MALLRDEEGQALPIVLMLLLLGAFFLTPALFYATTTLIGQRLGKDALVDQYSAESGVTYVMWKLLNNAYSLAPPASETITINSRSVTTTIATVPAPTYTDHRVQSASLAYAMAAGHQVWLVASNNDASDTGLYMAYDTVDAPARAVVPWTTAGATTYYFHNRPTPPVANTNVPNTDASIGMDALTMNTTAPTATTLYNYDANIDALEGRRIRNSADGTQCASKAAGNFRDRIIWRGPTLAAPDTISGPIVIRWWWGLENAGFGDHAITWWICDFDTASGVVTAPAALRNPDNIVGRINVATTTVLWLRPFDLSVTAGSRRLEARVDRMSGTQVKLKSWMVY